MERSPRLRSPDRDAPRGIVMSQATPKNGAGLAAAPSELDLPAMLGFLRGTIEGAVREHGGRLLEKE